jgi:hypothetical protein
LAVTQGEASGVWEEQTKGTAHRQLENPVLIVTDCIYVEAEHQSRLRTKFPHNIRTLFK